MPKEIPNGCYKKLRPMEFSWTVDFFQIVKEKSGFSLRNGWCRQAYGESPNSAPGGECFPLMTFALALDVLTISDFLISRQVMTE